MMAVIQNSYSNVVSSFFSQQFQRSIDELLVSPIPNYVILGGFVAGGLARGLAVGIIVAGLSVAFTDFSIHNPPVPLLVALITFAVFALAGFLNALYANSFDDISIIPPFVLTPLIYLGGVFYSVDLLPEAGRVVSSFNPIFDMVNTFRYGILGTSDVNIFWALAMLVVFVVILFTVCLVLLRRGTGLRH